MIGVSPGLSMQYSSAADRARLDAKVLGLLDAGADCVALFDDIPPYLQHPADLDAFGSLAEAHAEVSNHVADRLGSRSIPLAVCPTGYHGEGDEEYLVTLGSLLDGASTSSGPGGRSARRRSRPPRPSPSCAVRDVPLYWDNYPVNDVAMIHEAHLGPYPRRDPLLDRFSVGVMANAMEHAEASKIALATIADYLWAPASYDPERSWQRALPRPAVRMRGRCSASPDTVRGSCLAEPDPIDLGELERFEFDLAHGDAPAARLGRRPPSGSPAAEAGRLTPTTNDWPASYSRGSKFSVGAEALAALADAGRTAELRKLADELSSRPHVVFGSLLEMAIDRALQQHSEGEHP